MGWLVASLLARQARTPAPGCIADWRASRAPVRPGHWSANCGTAHTSMHDCNPVPAYDCGAPSIWDSNATPAASTIQVYYGGQLGNNMFQYAFGTRLAETMSAKGTKTKLVGHAAEGEVTPRWRRMDIEFAKVACPHVVSDRDNLVSKPMCEQLKAAMSSSCVRVDGFFQDFDAIGPERRDALVRAFAPMDDECDDAIPKDDEIVMHVRTCDYEDNVPRGPWPACYGSMPWEYYEVLLSTLRAKERPVSILTPPSCASGRLVKRLQREFGARRLASKMNDGRADFCYMLRAKTLILQPSTFGWWAGWLSNATEIHYPLLGLFAHQRTLNYPRGPKSSHPGSGTLKCDGLFQAPGGGTKSLVVPEPRYVYHDVIGGRYFGRYSGTTFHDWGRHRHVLQETGRSPVDAFCADPPRRKFKKSPRVIGLGPRSHELVCIAKLTELHFPDTPSFLGCCTDDVRKGTGQDDRKVLVFPRSQVEAALFYANESRPLDFNFIGRVQSKQAAVVRARQWVVDFARRHFTATSHFDDTTAARHSTKKKMGPWDKSGQGFTPMAAMGEQKANPCAMAKCDHSYYRTLGRSKFTLAPAGDQPWSQRFFEAAMAGSIPIVQSPEHTGRSLAEKKLGYKYLTSVEFASRFAAFRQSAGPDAPLPYCAAWAAHNLDVFLRSQTYIARRQTLKLSIDRCQDQEFV